MKAPWTQKPIDEWAIVGMNHYHLSGERRLFVAMTKGDRCIVEEGKDDEDLWNRLWHKAVAQGKETEIDKAQKIVAVIERDLTDRRGLRQEWEGIDDKIQVEIRETWMRLVREELVGMSTTNQ